MLSPQQLVDAINLMGGRKKPIIVLEHCECGEPFASTIQDHSMRKGHAGVPILCPPCREELNKKKAREKVAEKRRKQKAGS